MIEGGHKLLAYAGCALGLALAPETLLVSAMIGCISLMLHEM